MTIENITPLYEGHLRVNQVQVRTPDGALQKLERVERRDAVAALVYDPAAAAYLLVEQWRVGAEAPLLELPAGLIDGDESPETALRRELREELGVEVGELTAIATFYPSPGFCSEQIHLFAAEVTSRVGAGGGLATEGEALTVRPITAADFYHNTPLHDAKTLLAREWARPGRQGQH